MSRDTLRQLRLRGFCNPESSTPARAAPRSGVRFGGTSKTWRRPSLAGAGATYASRVKRRSALRSLTLQSLPPTDSSA